MKSFLKGRHTRTASTEIQDKLHEYFVPCAVVYVSDELKNLLQKHNIPSLAEYLNGLGLKTKIQNKFDFQLRWLEPDQFPVTSKEIEPENYEDFELQVHVATNILVDFETWMHPVTILIAVSSLDPVAEASKISKLINGKSIPFSDGVDVNVCRIHLLCYEEVNDKMEVFKHMCMQTYSAEIKNLQQVERILEDYYSQVLVPNIQRQTVKWNEQIANPRRGITGRFLSVSKKYFSKPLESKYNSLSDEIILRRLGDYLFFCREYQMALSAYQTASKCYQTDHATIHQAAAMEMSAVCSAVLGQTKEAEVMFEQSISLFQKSDKILCAIRLTIVLSYLCPNLKSQFLKRMAPLSNDVIAAIMLEESTRESTKRTSLKTLVLSASLFGKNQQHLNAVRCLKKAKEILPQIGWTQMKEHVYTNLARHSLELGYVDVAINECLVAFIPDARLSDTVSILNRAYLIKKEPIILNLNLKITGPTTICLRCSEIIECEIINDTLYSMELEFLNVISHSNIDFQICHRKSPLLISDKKKILRFPVKAFAKELGRCEIEFIKFKFETNVVVHVPCCFCIDVKDEPKLTLKWELPSFVFESQILNSEIIIQNTGSLDVKNVTFETFGCEIKAEFPKILESCSKHVIQAQIQFNLPNSSLKLRYNDSELNFLIDAVVMKPLSEAILTQNILSFSNIYSKPLSCTIISNHEQQVTLEPNHKFLCVVEQNPKIHWKCESSEGFWPVFTKPELTSFAEIHMENQCTLNSIVDFELRIKTNQKVTLELKNNSFVVFLGSVTFDIFEDFVFFGKIFCLCEGLNSLDEFISVSAQCTINNRQSFLNETALQNFLNAFQNKRDVVSKYTKMHADFFSQTHSPSFFFSYHRQFLLEFERELGASIPYWDIYQFPLLDKEKHLLFQRNTLGEFPTCSTQFGCLNPSEKCVSRACKSFRDPLPPFLTLEQAQLVIEQSTRENYVETVERIMESHIRIHERVGGPGGSMTVVDDGPNDPSFYLLHSFVDLIYMYVVENDDNDVLPSFQQRKKDVRNSIDLCYQYDLPSWLSGYLTREKTNRVKRETPSDLTSTSRTTTTTSSSTTTTTEQTSSKVETTSTAKVEASTTTAPLVSTQSTIQSTSSKTDPSLSETKETFSVQVNSESSTEKLVPTTKVNSDTKTELPPKTITKISKVTETRIPKITEYPPQIKKKHNKNIFLPPIPMRVQQSTGIGARLRQIMQQSRKNFPKKPIEKVEAQEQRNEEIKEEKKDEEEIVANEVESNNYEAISSSKRNLPFYIRLL